MEEIVGGLAGHEVEREYKALELAGVDSLPREAGVEIEQCLEAAIARKQQVLISDERLCKAKGQLMEQGWRMQAIYINPLPPTLVLPRKALAFHLLSIKLTQL